MSKKLHIIYVPGLGDQNPNRQRAIVKTWRWWGVTAELFQMNWADDVAWDTKFNKLLQRIDELIDAGSKVGLVGASAGSSAVINAYAARTTKIVGVVSIAGKINRAHKIGDGYRRKNPSFVDSAEACRDALASIGPKDRKRILSRYGLADEVVYKPDSRVDGAVNRLVPMVGHVPVIATQLLFGAPGFIRFLKRQAKLQAK